MEEGLTNRWLCRDRDTRGVRREHRRQAQSERQADRHREGPRE